MKKLSFIQFNPGTSSIFAAQVGTPSLDTALECAYSSLSNGCILHINYDKSNKTVKDKYNNCGIELYDYGYPQFNKVLTLTDRKRNPKVFIHTPKDRSVDELIESIKSFVRLTNVKIVVVDSLNFIDSAKHEVISKLTLAIKELNLIGIFTRQLMHGRVSVTATSLIDNFIIVEPNNEYKLLKGTFDNTQASPFSDFLQDENEKLRQENHNLKVEIEMFRSIQSIQQVFNSEV